MAVLRKSMRIFSYLFIIISIIASSGAASETEGSEQKMDEKVKYPESLRRLVETYMDLREYDRASSLIDELGADFGRDAVSARLYMLLGSYDKAIERLAGNGHPFQIGYCYESVEQYEEALSWYEKAWEADSLLRDYYLLRKGTCKLLAGKCEDAIGDLKRLGEEFPSSPFLLASYEGMAESFEGLGQASKASWLRRLIGRRWPWKKPEMDYLTALSLEEGGKEDEAKRLYYRLMRRSPDSEFALKALRGLKALTGLASADLFYSGRVLYYQGHYREAINDLQSHLDVHPDGELVKEAHYFLGKALFRRARYQEAGEQFQIIVNRYRKDPISLKAHFNVARCQSRMGEDEKAISSYGRLAEVFPKSYLTDDALYRIGTHYERRGELDRSLEFYRRLIKQVPDGDYSDDALFRMGLVHLRLGKPESAARELKRLVARKTSLREAATYWLGRSLEERGSPEEAEELYRALSSADPTSYYSICSRERLALLGQESLSLELSKQEPEEWMSWAEASPLSPEQTYHLLRGEKLLKLGFLQEGCQELKRVRSNDPFSLYRISSLFSEYGSDWEAIRYGSRIFWRALTEKETDFPAKLIHLLYPTPYWITIGERAEDFGINPFLLLALIRQESLFQPDAVSRAGAVGLTQVIPPTGEQIAKSLGDGNFNVEDLKKPEKSIRYGGYYLSQLLEEFDGRVDLALAAYNAGPVNVKGWLEADTNPQREWFIEGIPFWETRGYVKKVLSSFWVYSHLYQSSGE